MREKKMDTRALAAVLSSLISQLVLLLFVVSPDPKSTDFLFPHIAHFLSTSEIVTSLSLSKKRKRNHEPEDLIPPPAAGLGHWMSRLGHSSIPRSPDSFKLFFRMNPSTFEWLSALLEPLLECRDPVNWPLNLPAETRLGIGLFRLATGSDYSEIATRFGVSEPVARFCVKQLCRVLCTNFRFWVGFPSSNELGSLSDSFESLAGLPNCCGVVDCTRFKFFKKNGGDEESVAAQIVVDSSSRILSIVAGFNGSRSDSLVLKSTTLYDDIEGGNLLNSPPIDINGVSTPQYLVGDEGYPLLPWLIVPFVQPQANSHQEDFNWAHNLMRVSALKTIASLKNWGVLSRPVKAEFKTAVAYIGACSILHNALLMREDYSAFSDELGDYSAYDERSRYDGDGGLEENSVEQKAMEIRSALAMKARRS